MIDPAPVLLVESPGPPSEPGLAWIDIVPDELVGDGKLLARARLALTDEQRERASAETWLASIFLTGHAERDPDPRTVNLCGGRWPLVASFTEVEGLHTLELEFDLEGRLGLRAHPDGALNVELGAGWLRSTVHRVEAPATASDPVDLAGAWTRARTPNEQLRVGYALAQAERWEEAFVAFRGALMAMSEQAQLEPGHRYHACCVATRAARMRVRRALRSGYDGSPHVEPDLEDLVVEMKVWVRAEAAGLRGLIDAAGDEPPRRWLDAMRRRVAGLRIGDDDLDPLREDADVEELLEAAGLLDWLAGNGATESSSEP